MNGRIVGSVLVLSAIVAGAAMYYLQVYAYYTPVSAQTDIALTAIDGTVEPIPVRGFEGIDADSSPLRFRACFTVDVSLGTLTETFRLADRPEPLTGPGWFSCYDAAAVGAALEAGDAIAFLGQAEIHPGVDRIVAITRDGRGYAWHQLNATLRD